MRCCEHVWQSTGGERTLFYFLKYSMGFMPSDAALLKEGVVQKCSMGTAFRLEKSFEAPAEFWMRLQSDYDVAQERAKRCSRTAPSTPT